jgi:hypothetical protein
LFTGILAVFTGGLWWATLRLARDAKKPAIHQAADSEPRQVLSGKLPLLLSDVLIIRTKLCLSLCRLLYSGKVSPPLYAQKDRIEQFIFWVDMQNYGSTLATHVEFWMLHKVAPWGETDVPMFQKPPH